MQIDTKFSAYSQKAGLMSLWY